MNFKKAKKLYEKFSGKKQESTFDIDLGNIDNLAFLGVPARIEYVTTKPHLGDNEPVQYYHDFEGAPVLVAKDGVLIIYDENIRITDRGIEG